MTIICAAMLALPGRTVTAAFTNDVLIFLDGAHRIASGQLPNRDFHTALGPLVFLIPAAGYWLTGNLGAAMPVGMAVLLLAVMPALIAILNSRLHPPIAVALGGFLILILAAPINLGSPVSLLSFAMFYNRIGWVALSLLLVMYLRPRERSVTTEVTDAAAASLLLLLQFYTKATYGLVSLGFIAFMLTDERQRRWAAGSLLFTLVAAALIELGWGGTWQHVEDLMAAAQVSGARDLASLVRSGLNNLADLTVFAIAAGVALWRTRSLRDLLFYGFCVTAGLLILNQNAHGWGIITLYAGAAVATELLVRLRSGDRGVAAGRPSLADGLPLLLVFLLLPSIVHHGAVLARHAVLAATDAGRPLGLPKLRDLRVPEPTGSPNFMNRYHESIESGGKLLLSLSPTPERVVVLDFVNPFSGGLGLRPPAGDSSWLHWGRNIDGSTHPAPEVMFADAQFVMIPKVGINSLPLQQLYGPFISRTFQLVQETDAWIVYEKRQPQETMR
jgi:hypothetical protein